MSALVSHTLSSSHRAPGHEGSSASQAEALSSRVRAVVLGAIEEQRLVGAVVLVARHGAVLHRQAAGLADREAHLAMTEDTAFRLASVSKPIVAAAAMALVSQGRLDLDAAVSQYLPDFQPRLPDGRVARITLRHLLSHTAGLGYRFLEADAQGPYARAGVSDGLDAVDFDLQENLRRLASVPLLYEPGSSWCYSLSLDVVGAVIAQVQGVPLDVAVRALLTQPLGMAETGFSAEASRRVATAYVNASPHPRRLGEGDIEPVFAGTVGIRYSPSRVWDGQAFASGGAGMVGTADDFLRLLEALRQGGGGLIAPHWVDEMGRDQVKGIDLPSAPGFGFGLGFSVLRDPAQAQSPESPGTWRWGGAYGHAWFVDRAQGWSVVAFTNTLYEGMSGRFVTDLRDAVYGALPSASLEGAGHA